MKLNGKRKQLFPLCIKSSGRRLQTASFQGNRMEQEEEKKTFLKGLGIDWLGVLNCPH
jgi:hypothetical protein